MLSADSENTPMVLIRKVSPSKITYDHTDFALEGVYQGMEACNVDTEAVRSSRLPSGFRTRAQSGSLPYFCALVMSPCQYWETKGLKVVNSVTKKPCQYCRIMQISTRNNLNISELHVEHGSTRLIDVVARTCVPSSHYPRECPVFGWGFALKHFQAPRTRAWPHKISKLHVNAM